MRTTAGLDKIILRAKLQRPRAIRNLVLRSRLHERLNEGLRGPLSVVVAPAGFGKTTLISSWVEELMASRRPSFSGVPMAWLSLDEEESDPGNFLRYFVSAIRTIFPDAAPETTELIRARQDPPLDYLSSVLSNEIEQLPTYFIVVLDDVHVLRDEGVFDLLESWMRHWPQTMHMVMISRVAPPISLTNWRALGRVTELHARDLRFTEAETAEFLQLTLGEQVEAEAVTTLHDQLEGWVAGMRLALVSQGGQHVPNALSAYLKQFDNYLTSYLLDEGLLNLPWETQQFLLNIAVTRQFCESLCVALLQDRMSAKGVHNHLEYLVSNEIFLTVVDEEGNWYRLHHLFQDMLLKILRREDGDEAILELHARAARWYAANGLIDEALHHARETADVVLLREIMQHGFRTVLNHEDRPTLERWLAMVPPEAIEQDPWLAMMRAWDHGFRWELENLKNVLGRAAELVDRSEANALDSAERKLLIGQIGVLQGHVTYHANQPDAAVVHCKEGLKNVPDSWRYVRGVGSVYLGLALQASGREREAEQIFTSRYEGLANKTDSYAARLLQGLALVSLQTGSLGKSLRVLDTMLRQSEKGNLPVIQGWAHYLLGYVHYHRAELDEAETHFSKAIALRFKSQLLVARRSLAGLATTYQAQGKTEQAFERVDELSQLEIQLYGLEKGLTSAMRAWLYLSQGDLDRANAWSESITLPPPDQPMLPWLEVEPLIRVGVLIARKDEQSLGLALDTLAMLDANAERTYNRRAPVVLQAWRAMAELARGDVVAARQALVHSVELSRRTGHKQIYTDLGEPMQQLLGQIAGERSVADSISDIRGSTVQISAEIVRESLTRRELQILTLMADPISFGNISEQLDIARSTTKRHTINLYQKLGVHSRWDAVAKAIELGILSKN